MQLQRELGPREWKTLGLLRRLPDGARKGHSTEAIAKKFKISLQAARALKKQFLSHLTQELLLLLPQQVARRLPG
jgi:hypothetical protein